MSQPDKDPPRDRRLYGRRRGPKLSKRQKQLLVRDLPAHALQDPSRPGASFPHPGRPLWLEIGFGKGEHLAWQAARHPGVNLIGAEFYINGIAGLLSRITGQGLQNIRIHDGDARRLIESLPDGCIGRAFLIQPDPWPKRRHAGRRFVQKDSLRQMARVMKPGAELRISTDNVILLRWILRHLMADPAFEWRARGPRDWREKPADWPETRYETKAGRSGDPVTYLIFRRTAGKQA